MIQSNRWISAIAASSGAKSCGSANETSGSTTGLAPRAESSLASTSLFAAERVMTIRLPSKALGDASGTLAAHFFQDRLRARRDECPRHVLSKLRRLTRRSGSALLHVLRPIHGTNARVEQ